MDASEAENNLELEVKDFGPILEARIELRPLTVFIGPGNTGKSYLAILIYALHRLFSSDGSIGSRSHSRHRPTFANTRFKEPSERLVADLLEFFNQVILDEKRKFTKDTIALPGSILNSIRDGIDHQGGDFRSELGRCFGIENVDALIRKGNTDTAYISLRMYQGDAATSIGHRLAMGDRDSRFNTLIPDDARTHLGIRNDADTLRPFRDFGLSILSRGNRDKVGSRLVAWELLDFLADHVRARTVGPFRLPAFYLPADRTGVMHARNVVVSALIESAAMTGSRAAARAPMLSGVQADFLQQLIHLDEPSYGRRPRRLGIDTRIERSILGGSIRVDKSEAVGYPHFTYNPVGWKNSLPLTSASSMVSELAPVVLYLRHVVRPGDVLIVEEPESHLHPEMQVQFTRQLAGLVEAGIRVIITTHSEWVLEELANVVRRSGLPTPDEGAHQGTSATLRPDQVGAWLFRKKGSPKGSTVKELVLDEETGLYPTDYDAVREELYNESVSIFNRIQE